MDRLKMHSVNRVDENIKKIYEMFPNCVTERKNKRGEVEHAVDFDMLKQELSPVIVEGREERYQFTWPDKKKSILLANTEIDKTLRPCREESVEFDNTENLYIEGDNLEVLKLLQETYLGKVKMIYIDPPYNTGNDSFIYDDRRFIDIEKFIDISGQYDENNRVIFDMRNNNERNGRFHTDWLNMMYPRIKLARDLLTDDGVIFISIDDNEQCNLKKVCDEIFSEENFVAEVIWKRKRGRDNSAKWFSKAHEYLLIYTKDKKNFNINYLELDEKTKKAYKNPDNDIRGIYRMLGCWARGTQGGVEYDFTTKEGMYFSKRLWLLNKDNLRKLDQDDKLIIRGDNIYRKMFIYENKGKIPETLWDNVSNSANASDELKRIFKGIVFETPKPIPYLIEMLRIASNKDSIVLDFFSGSSTTAHAVMELNAEDGGQRKFIMVQIPEMKDEKSEAFKAGYKNVCEIGKERIRRAGAKIKEEYGEKVTDLDIGFRVLKCDSTNMKDVYYNPSDFQESYLESLADNIKEDRSPEDLLFQVMLDLGVLLSSKIEETVIDGKNVFSVNDGYLIACFDDDINDRTVEAIANMKPYYAVFRDSGYSSDSVATNFEQIFNSYSPNTERWVL